MKCALLALVQTCALPILQRRVAPRLPPLAFTPFVEIHAAFAVEIPGCRIRRATGAMSQANVFWRGDVTGFFDGWAMVLVAVVVVDPHVAGGGPNTGSHQSPVAPWLAATARLLIDYNGNS